MAVLRSLGSVRERIDAAARRSGRNPDAVRLVVVTKGVTLAAVREALEAGAGIFGESRIQEALPKIAALGDRAEWHLIGTLQRNKVRRAVGTFEVIHSVDRPELAEEIDRRAAEAGRVQKILIQVNVSGETAKAGVPPGEAAGLVRAAGKLRNLDLRGLMTIPPLPGKPEDSRPFYRALRALGEAFRSELGIPFPELSMGMSGDFEVAVEEGATMVRVGTAIFS